MKGLSGSSPPAENSLLKIYPAHFRRDSRDERELTLAAEIGFKPVMMVKDYTWDRPTEPSWDWQITSTRPLGPHAALVHLNRVVSFFAWAQTARQLRPKVISGHNLTGLLIGWLANIGLPKEEKSALIYDAHEFTVGQQVGWRRALVRLLEGFLIRRCEFTIVVNNAIADRVQSLHRLEQRPIVVRSTPENWPINDEATAEKRAQFLLELNMPDDTFILMYHGAVLPGRGIETLMHAIRGRAEVALIVLGDAQDPKYSASLKQLSVDLQIDQRVTFKQSVNIEDLCCHIGASDVGMVTVLPISDSYRLMLPNKFFENIQALTPVIVSDFPEIGEIVRHYGLGIAVDPKNLNAIGNAIDELRRNTVLRDRFHQNLQQAKKEFSWERESREIHSLYSALLSTGKH